MNYMKNSIEDIHKNILDNISNDYMKGIGTFPYDLTKSFAIQSSIIEKYIENLYLKLDVNNLYGDELDRFVFQRKGLKRKQAICSIGELEVKGNGTVKINDLFETESGQRFKATETKIINDIGVIKIEATEAGASGNVGANTINLIPITIQGIISVNNLLPTVDGFDIESDKSLKERYFIEIQKPATSGNVYHYMQWSREVQGVGDSRIFPLWNGNNTVQIIVIDDNKKNATNELIERVQLHIDPKGKNNSTWGSGYGEAPIGAYCTVISAIPKEININCTLILKTGETVETIKDKLKEQIELYLKEIAFKKDYVSFALLSSWILQTEGVQEWTSLTINNGSSNIKIENKEVAILGGLIINVQA